MFWSFLYFVFDSRSISPRLAIERQRERPFCPQNITAQMYRKELLGLTTKDNLTVTHELFEGDTFGTVK
jgi:hypothetical protein